MSVLRTAYPNDSFTAATDGGPVTITSAGTDVPDQYVAAVRAQAAAQGVLLLDGAAAGTPAAPLAQRVQVLEQLVTGLLTPLVEQPQLVVGPVWPLARSGQTVPVSMAGATSGKTLTLEPGGTGSRLAVRLDVAATGGYALTLAGSAGDTVPAVQLTAAGTIVYLEGFVGGGGWRVVGRSGGDGTVPWASVTGAPTIPTQLSQLGGSVTDQQIPDAITRDSELANGLAGKADAHSHPYASSGHTHPASPRMIGPYTPSSYSALASGASGRTVASVVVPDPGFEWTPLCFAQLECRCASGSRAGVAVYKSSVAAGNMVAHGAGLDPVNQGANGNGYWMVPAIPYYGGNATVSAGASTAARTFLLSAITDYGSGNIESTQFYAQMQVWVVPN